MAGSVERARAARAWLKMRPGSVVAEASFGEHPHDTESADAGQGQHEENDKAKEKTIHGAVSFPIARWR